MKVFLDTNILLDYGQIRKDFLYAKAIMELGERGDIDLYASYLSYANMGYILRHYPIEEMEFSNLPVYTSKEFLIYNFRRKG